jgi:pimeloyl-ACP methyl ester carboxylesterase/DNA-binding CsgD family transcriptional regulator
MEPPPIQYVRSEDGFDIAYTVCGGGPPLVFTGAGLMHSQLAWQMPRLRDWLQGLAARFQLVQFDSRGTGLSARDLPPDHRVERYQHDIEAVIERLGLERFILFGHSFLPTCIATQYAVQNPGRVSAVILSGTVSALASQRAPALFAAFPNEDWDIFLRTIVEVGHQPESPAQADEMVELFRQAYDQQDFLLMVVAANRFSLVDLLPQLTTPTLVLNTRSAGLYPLEESLKVARLARAKLVSLDGQPSLGDADQGLRAIEAFLAAIPAESTRVDAEPRVPLSTREAEVLGLIARGLSNQQIADELVISVRTVERHINHIYVKIGAHNKAQATAYAMQRGLVTTPQSRS